MVLKPPYPPSTWQYRKQSALQNRSEQACVTSSWCCDHLPRPHPQALPHFANKFDSQSLCCVFPHCRMKVGHTWLTGTPDTSHLSSTTCAMGKSLLMQICPKKVISPFLLSYPSPPSNPPPPLLHYMLITLMALACRNTRRSRILQSLFIGHHPQGEDKSQDSWGKGINLGARSSSS